MAELKIVAQNTSTISFNYEELKGEILAKAQEYEVAVYSAENIGIAKADRARLNKLKTALNEERLKREREFMLPFMEFKSQVADLISIIDKPIKAIDTQVKEFETAQKEQKRDECKRVFDTYRCVKDFPEWLEYEQIENPKWLNKTVSLATVEEEIGGAIQKVNSDIDMIQNYCPNPSVGVAHYKKTLDLQKSMELGRMVAETEKPKSVEPAPEEEAEWVSFRALLTPTQAKALAGFFKTNHITFEKGE